MAKTILVQQPDGTMRKGYYFADRKDITIWLAKKKLNNLKMAVAIALAIGLSVSLLHNN